MAVSIALLYLLMVALVYFFQEKILFLPSKLPMEYTFSFNQPFEEFFLTTKDNAKLNAVHINNSSTKGVVLYFHGNSGNISVLNAVADLITENGYDALLVDYRTYGKSTGKLSELALNEDAQLFYDYAKKIYDENDIILYGRSFGTGIVSCLASKNKPNRVILESPFYSVLAMGKYRFPFLPISWLAKYKFPSHTYLQNVHCPIYIFHGTADKVVPYKFGEKLFESIPNKEKKIFTIANGGHKNLYDFQELTLGMNHALQ